MESTKRENNQDSQNGNAKREESENPGLTSTASEPSAVMDQRSQPSQIKTSAAPVSGPKLQAASIQNPNSIRTLERRFVINVFNDQRDIWTSPFRFKKKDTFWLLPMAGFTFESLHRDTYTYRSLTPTVNPGNFSKTFSDAGLVALAGGVGTMYVWGRVTDNAKARETGVLGVEAATNSFLLGSALKYSLRRQRPFAGTGRGGFFESGGDSFPSGHAILAWSMASVIAHEYPGVLTKIGVYGLASAVSVSRVTGRKHFPTDVVVGSALGWAVGRYVYKKHHDTDLPDMNIGTIIKDSDETIHASIASVYVPLDSWVYPAFDRLNALGFTPSAFRNLRPWTRNDCKRMVLEAEAHLEEQQGIGHGDEASRIVSSLREEFNSPDEKDSKSMVRLESVYTRVTGISGPPLFDGFHFAQSVYNDYGRPFREGMNVVSGASGWASSGRWAAYFRAEYQHAPSAPPLPFAARLAISNPATGDAIPVQPATPFQQVDRGRILDAYVTMNLRDFQISFGQQSLWWGPGEMGAMNFSNNAEPITMLRISRVTPLTLPGPFSLMGPVRGEYIVGRMTGHNFVRTVNGLFTAPIHPQPLISGVKLSFKPTPNLEFGFSASTVFGGPGFPVTLHSFLQSFIPRDAFPGAANDPGDRRSGFDFSYRIPGIRDWMILYNDSMSEDEPNPLAYPRRSAMRSGVYLPKIPKLNHLDLRVEGVYTALPNLRGTGVYFFNTRYIGGFTNQGNIMGDWIGREGVGVSVQSRYWFSPRRSIQFGYRSSATDHDFLGGGDLKDFRTAATWNLGPSFDFSGNIQWERWNYPVLGPSQTSVITSFQLTYKPRKRGK